MTSCKAYVTTENCIQILANLKELNSLVEETVRNMGMICSRYQGCIHVQDINNEILTSWPLLKVVAGRPRTILGWISRRWDVGIWTGLGWPRIETGDGRL